LDKSESVTIWSTSLDERVFQLNARLLDLTELSETLNFHGEKEQFNQEIERLRRIESRLDYVVSCNGNLTNEQYQQIVSQFIQ